MKKNAHFSFSNQKIDNNLFELERNFKHFKDFDYYFEYTMFQNEVKLYVNEAKLSESRSIGRRRYKPYLVKLPGSIKRFGFTLF